VSIPFFEWNEEPDKAACLRGKLYGKPGKGLKKDQRRPPLGAKANGSESASHWGTVTRKTKHYKKKMSRGFERAAKIGQGKYMGMMIVLHGCVIS
jgi:hypothetical protein